MKKTIYIILFMALSGLSGCMLGPDFQKPQYSGQDNFRFGTGDTLEVNLKWWELMDDPVLDTLILTAINENKDVLFAAARIEEARANIGYIDADRWPKLNFGAGVNVGSSWGNISSGFSAYPEFSWEIGFWGKYRRMNEATLSSYLATEYAQRTIQISLVSAVATTYFTILASYDQLDIAQSTLASRDSGLIIMNDKYEGGMISQMDLNQAKIQRDIAAAVVPVYKRLISLNENALSILLGKNPQRINVGEPFNKHNYEFNIPMGLPSELLERRPDVKQAEELYHAQLAQVGVAEALRWPSLSLTGLFGAVSNELLSINAVGLTWSAGAGIFSPVYQFGKNKRRVEMAKANAKAALIDYEKATQQAFRDVEDALVNISTFREELTAQESRTETAVISENLSYVRYDEGSTTYLEVLEQQRQSFSSQLDVLTTRLNLLNSYILLYKALGGGWLSPEEEKAYLNKKQGNN
jgi:multidrug efflux system outer membrane protein